MGGCHGYLRGCLHTCVLTPRGRKFFHVKKRNRLRRIQPDFCLGATRSSTKPLMVTNDYTTQSPPENRRLEIPQSPPENRRLSGGLTSGMGHQHFRDWPDPGPVRPEAFGQAAELAIRAGQGGAK